MRYATEEFQKFVLNNSTRTLNTLIVTIKPK